MPDKPRQPDLFSPTHALYRARPPFVRGSATSEAAANSIAPHVGGIKRKVLGVVAANPGITCDAIEVILGGRHQTVSARVRELEQGGFLFIASEDGMTRSGRAARCYDITKAGRLILSPP